MRAWVRRHPWLTTAIGSGATVAAIYYGGPAGQAAAEKALPFLCDVLKFCA